MKDGGPAFPGYKNADGSFRSTPAGGMTLRDWFAGQALAGWVANTDADDNCEQTAIWAYRYADAMLVEREKGGHTT
jgi:hypothetical protein